MTQILNLSREASAPVAPPACLIAEQAVARLLDGHDLSRAESQTLFETIVEGRLDQPLMAAAFVALRMRGETADELIGAATALRMAARAFPSPDDLFADSCGTGGDFSGSINVSTAAAFVAAACGLPVIKHGNRSFTSRCGSADVLEALGARLDLSPLESREILDRTGFCFLLAPFYHPGIAHAGPVRRALKVRTIMNLLGPCLNPARPKVQLLGVAEPRLLRPIAETLHALGVERALVVHGSGLDEIALHGFTQAIRLENGEYEELEITPEQAGLRRLAAERIVGGTPAHNAQRLASLLAGEGREADEAIVALNAGALLMTADIVPDLHQGVAMALDSIRSGQAIAALDASSRRAVAEGMLGRIAAAKREELAGRFDGVSLDALRSRARPTDRSLRATLAQSGARFILEIKKASPSGGGIRIDADPAKLARGFAGVADALSVLCDRQFFGGSLDDLATARSQFDGPILAKDFFLDPRQVAEARIAGADAILVMLSLLDDHAARMMIGEARRFGMDALVEVHDESEMRRALHLGAPLIGINNRDLRDLSIDLSTTERLAPLAPGRLLVSESGISTREDIERLSPRVDAFLVGSSLMRANEPAQAARELIFGRTKLCGLKCGADVRAARPAAFAGFVFVAGSPRHVTALEAEPLAGLACKSGMLPVGVFRDAPLRIVADLAARTKLHAVQLHGREDAQYVRALRRMLPRECEIWTAVSVGRDPAARDGERLVFDNGEGGSGRTFDWSLVADHPALPQALVAGGIGPHNARAARRLGAYAIDVGSSVDRAPELKSAEKIGALFDVLRPDCREQLSACA